MNYRDRCVAQISAIGTYGSVILVRACFCLQVSHLYETHADKEKEGDYPQKGTKTRQDDKW